MAGFRRSFRDLADTAGYEVDATAPFERTSIAFLDVEVFVDGMNLAWRLHTKPTQQKSSLGPDSAHSRSVIRSWPVAEVYRRFKRCKYRIDLCLARDAHLVRLREHGYPHDIIKEVTDAVPDRSVGGPVRQRARFQVFWVLPYHPWLESLRLATFLRQSLSAAGLSDMINIRCSVVCNVGSALRRLQCI